MATALEGGARVLAYSSSVSRHEKIAPPTSELPSTDPRALQHIQLNVAAGHGFLRPARARDIGRAQPTGGSACSLGRDPSTAPQRHTHKLQKATNLRSTSSGRAATPATVASSDALSLKLSAKLSL